MVIIIGIVAAIILATAGQVTTSLILLGFLAFIAFLAEVLD